MCGWANPIWGMTCEILYEPPHGAVYTVATQHRSTATIVTGQTLSYTGGFGDRVTTGMHNIDRRTVVIVIHHVQVRAVIVI